MEQRTLNFTQLYPTDSEIDLSNKLNDNFTLIARQIQQFKIDEDDAWSKYLYRGDQKTVTNVVDITGLDQKEILYGNILGEIGQTDTFIYDYSSDANLLSIGNSSPSLWSSTYGDAVIQMGTDSFIAADGSDQLAIGVNAFHDTTDDRWELVGATIPMLLEIVGGASAEFIFNMGLVSDANGAIAWSPMFEISDTEISMNEDGQDCDIRMESASLTHAFFLQGSDGFLGLNEETPGTILDIASTVPYVTLHNTTHENTDGGRESKFIFEGEKGDGTLHTLAEQTVSHDGTGDDYWGNFLLQVYEASDSSPALRTVLTTQVEAETIGGSYLALISPLTKFGLGTTNIPTTGQGAVHIGIGAASSIFNVSSTTWLTYNLFREHSSPARIITDGAAALTINDVGLVFYLESTGAAGVGWDGFPVFSIGNTGGAAGGTYDTIIATSHGISGAQIWKSGFSVIETPSSAISFTTATSGTSVLSLSTNAFYNNADTDWHYRQSGTALLYEQSTTTHDHIFKVAASGTGAITWTDVCTFAIGGTTLNVLPHEGTDVDVFLVANTGLVKYRTGAEVLSDIGGSSTSHRHDGQTLEHDAVNSDGGAFSFNTTGAVAFNQAISSTGSITGNSFITASNIGIVGDLDIIQLTGANAMTVNGTLYTGNISNGDLAPLSTIPLLVYYNNYSMTATSTGAYVFLRKRLGVSNNADDLTAGFFHAEMYDADSAIGNLKGLVGNAKIRDGEVGESGSPHDLQGLRFAAVVEGGTVWGTVSGKWVEVNASGGTIKEDVMVDHSKFTGGATIDGTSYMHYYEEATAPDYCIYQNGTAPSHFGGDIRIASDTNGLVLGVGQDFGLTYNGAAGSFDSSLIAPSDIDITCGAEKTIRLVNTVTRDLQFAVSPGKVPAANFPNYEAFGTQNTEYAFDVDEYIDLQANELYHTWAEGTTAEFHIHFWPKTLQNTGANRYAKFTVYISYADTSEVLAETSLTAEYTIPTGTAALTHLLLDMGDLALPNNLIGTQVEIRVKRVGATGGVEYADSVFISQVGSHILNDTIGSRTTYEK